MDSIISSTRSSVVADPLNMMNNLGWDVPGKVNFTRFPRLIQLKAVSHRSEPNPYARMTATIRHNLHHEFTSAIHRRSRIHG
jgi:hypothetical protein